MLFSDLKNFFEKYCEYYFFGKEILLFRLVNLQLCVLFLLFCFGFMFEGEDFVVVYKVIFYNV